MSEYKSFLLVQALIETGLVIMALVSSTCSLHTSLYYPLPSAWLILVFGVMSGVAYGVSWVAASETDKTWSKFWMEK